METQQVQSRAGEVQPRNFWRFLAMLILALIIVTGVIVIIIWFALQPKKLEYSIERSSITGYNLTAEGRLTATFGLLLRARNPNRRVSFYYDKVDVRASFENTDLFIGKINPFYQRRLNVTDLELSMAADNVVVGGAVAEHLKMERVSGDVKLEVKIGAKIRLKIGLFKVHRTVEALCGPFDVPFSETKRFSRADCDVDIND